MNILIFIDVRLNLQFSFTFNGSLNKCIHIELEL